MPKLQSKSKFWIGQLTSYVEYVLTSNLTFSRSEDIITYGRTKVSILVTVLFSVLYNVPRFLEISWQEFTNEDPITGHNVTRAETIPTGLVVGQLSSCQ